MQNFEVKTFLAAKTVKGLDFYMVNILKLHVLNMQDFKGVDFGCCLGLRCSYFT